MAISRCSILDRGYSKYLRRRAIPQTPDCCTFLLKRRIKFSTDSPSLLVTCSKSYHLPSQTSFNLFILKQSGGSHKPSTRKLFAAQYVHVEVVDQLSPGAAVIDYHAGAAFQTSLMCHLAGSQQQPAGQVHIFEVIQPLKMLLGHHQYMHRRFGMNIIESYRDVVLP